MTTLAPVGAFVPAAGGCGGGLCPHPHPPRTDGRLSRRAPPLADDPPSAAARGRAAARAWAAPPPPPRGPVGARPAADGVAHGGTPPPPPPPPHRWRRAAVAPPPRPPADDVALAVGVLVCVALTAVLGAAGGRLAGVPLRLARDAPFDYPWRLRGRPGGWVDGAAAAAAGGARRWSAWALYAAHQVAHWRLIGATRAARGRQREGGAAAAAAVPPPPVEAGAPDGRRRGRGQRRRRGSPPPHTLGWPQRATLALHAAAAAARVAHTHLLSYDGLASDVPEVTSLAAVALLLVWVWVLEAPRRGVAGGARPRPLTAPALRSTAVATHGYYFSFATVYTLWYHPAAATAAHLSGFFYVFLLLLQGGLAGTAAHGRRGWTGVLEGGVAVHALITAATVGGGRLVPLFGWGLATSFMAVHLHGLGLPRWVRGGVVAAYGVLAAVAVAVGWGGPAAGTLSPSPRCSTRGWAA
ncbi:hypothetical protein BU14_0340s0013 [Porphyra umbilicalis]|uniref:Uncharacterized protein n=1 Tax=Porphyra umbilicalis TaxID=2786 RepID=A0A1X6NY24_PORUM|nr:hypothetical protein BU14_0340s0013 [Porphyra umbilicalis]|eukprot:OSX73529.1 hypothetical protein BU14_0340s0013 [Porphyra umbilicalis]